MKANNWVRSVLGLGAVLLVAAPSMVLAVYDPSYTPQSLVVQGPSTLTVGQTNVQYSAFVTFTNGQTATLTTVPPLTSWSTTNAARATVNSNGQVTAVSAGLVGIQATLVQQGVQVGGVKLVRISP